MMLSAAAGARVESQVGPRSVQVQFDLLLFGPMGGR